MSGALVERARAETGRALAARIMLSSSIAGQRESVAADFTLQKQCRFQRVALSRRSGVRKAGNDMRDREFPSTSHRYLGYNVTPL